MEVYLLKLHVHIFHLQIKGEDSVYMSASFPPISKCESSITKCEFSISKLEFTIFSGSVYPLINIAYVNLPSQGRL